jgi:flagellar hook-length control protein FliK
MANEVAITLTPPAAVPVAAGAPVESTSGGDFFTALANVLAAEAAAVASAPVTAELVDNEIEVEELELPIDPQAVLFVLEQAQRGDSAVTPEASFTARSTSSTTERSVLAAMSAAGAALAAQEPLAKVDPAKGGIDAPREIHSDLRGPESSAAHLANAAHERLAELGERPTIRAHVGTANWTEQLAGKLTLMVGRGIQTASIQLSPENLGPLEVRISVQNDQASVWFGASHAETRTALEQALPRLRELLAGQGLNLSDAGVFRETPRQPQKAYVPPASGASEGEREFNVAIGVRGMVDAYA